MLPGMSNMPGKAANGDAPLPDSLGDLKARIAITDVVSPYIKLTRRGSSYVGHCPFHPDRTPSFHADDRWRRFRCFGCGAAGDVIDFVARIEGLDTGDAIRWLREQAGGALPDPKVHAARMAREAAAKARDAVQIEAKRAAAQQVWRESVAIVDGPPWVYLTQHRGLTRWDGDRLRYHPACGFGWIDTAPFGFRRTAPTIVAPVTCHKTGYVVGIWRIRLTPAGELVHRLGLGDVKGNAARLFEPEGDTIAIAEGVEDALAFHKQSGLPSWAALNAGNMAELILPLRLRRVVIVQDNDEPDRHGRRAGPSAAQTLARRLLAEGRAVGILNPKCGKDANDVLLAGRSIDAGA
jgi:DNA primase